MTHNLILLSGVAGVGKSTFALELKKSNEERGLRCRIVSSDEIRKQLTGNESTQDKNNLVYSTMMEELRSNNEWDITILDSCLTKYKSRKTILAKIRDLYDGVLLCTIDDTLENIKRKNASRERVVPTTVIESMYQSFKYANQVSLLNELSLVYNISVINGVLRKRSDDSDRQFIQLL